jgi:TatD DNase family protein
MPLIDSHCHLNYPQFQPDFPELLARAEASGVSLMQTICTKMSEFDNVHRLALEYPQLYCSVGVHPHESGKEPLVSVETLCAKAALPKVIGLGETGLDYYYEHSDRAIQQTSFRHHLEASRLSGLPVIVHTREADEDTVRILQEEMAKGAFPFLIHCFTSSQWLADAVLEMGGSISISGIITFKKAEALQETVKTLPLERILVETDSPYLAPIPHRGGRNEPAYTRYVCQKIAELKGMSYEMCETATTENFFRLFTRAAAA